MKRKKPIVTCLGDPHETITVKGLKPIFEKVAQSSKGKNKQNKEKTKE